MSQKSLTILKSLNINDLFFNTVQSGDISMTLNYSTEFSRAFGNKYYIDEKAYNLATFRAII